MIAVILTAHVLVVIALIGVVLLQRSEGGALGIGGGGGGFMTGRGAANALTRTTSFLAALFFATSLALAIVARSEEDDSTVLQELTGAPAGSSTVEQGAPATADDLLRTLGADKAAAQPGTGVLEEAVEAPPAAAEPAPPSEDAAPASQPAEEAAPAETPAETEDGAPPETTSPDSDPNR